MEQRKGQGVKDFEFSLCLMLHALCLTPWALPRFDPKQ